MKRNDGAISKHGHRPVQSHRDPPPLRFDEGALALNMSVKTLRDWAAQRRFAVIRLGRAIRIPQSEIDRLLEEGTVPAKRASK